MGFIVLGASLTVLGLVGWICLAGTKCPKCEKFLALAAESVEVTEQSRIDHVVEYQDADTGRTVGTEHKGSIYEETRNARLHCTSCGHRLTAETLHRSDDGCVPIGFKVFGLLIGPLWILAWFRPVLAAMLAPMLPGALVTLISWLGYLVVLALVLAILFLAASDSRSGSWKWMAIASGLFLMMCTAFTVPATATQVETPRMKKVKQAIADIGYIFQQPDADVPELCAARVTSMLQQQRWDDAIETADRFAAWAERNEKHRNLALIDAAACYARCAAADKAHSDELVEKSVALLEKVKAAGYFTPETTTKLYQERDFFNVNQHPKFAAFLNSLGRQ